MWNDIIWWIVLILTILSVLVLPGLVQLLWEELKKLKEDKDG